MPGQGKGTGQESLRVFFANITFCSEKALDYSRLMQGYHSVGVVETHHRVRTMELNAKKDDPLMVLWADTGELGFSPESRLDPIDKDSISVHVYPKE